MELKVTNISDKELGVVKGRKITSADKVGLIEELSYEAHSNVDIGHVPFWATEVQDVIENACMTYSKDDIEAERFLGLKIQKADNSIIVSLGLVGEKESVFSVEYGVEQDENGEFVLGDVIRYGTLELVA